MLASLVWSPEIRTREEQLAAWVAVVVLGVVVAVGVVVVQVFHMEVS